MCILFLLTEQGLTKDTDFKDTENVNKTEGLLLKNINQAETPLPEILNHMDAPLSPFNTSEVFAFSAELSSNTELAAGSTIIFDREITNVGGFYFPNSGQFVCPDKGLYIFLWSIRKVSVEDLPGMRCIAKLFKGGADVKYGPKTNYFGTGSSGAAEMMTVTECTTSPLTAVTVVTEPWSEAPGSTSFYAAWGTSFSGFKLQSPITFIVELSKTQFQFPSGRIMFDRVVFNFGGYYDATNHYFRCPDNGLYVFSISTYTSDPSTPWSVSALMMEKEKIIQAPITFIATETYDSGSAFTTAVLRCTEGSSVYVETQASYDFLYSSYGPELTSFTGFKLYDVAENIDAIAFTVIMSSNVSITSGPVLFIFDEIITNIGSAFDHTISQFVCPDNDYYLFTWSAAAIYGGGFVDLYLDNSIRQERNYVTRQNPSHASGTSGSSSISVIKQCSFGTKFSIIADGTNGSTVYLGGFTTFSGYKIPGDWSK